MNREIGSNFDLNPNLKLSTKKGINLEQFGLKGSNTVFLSSGRGAEGFVLDEIETRNPDIKKIAFIPPFTCETVIEPFKKRGYKIFTYSISSSLKIDSRMFQEELMRSNAQVVLMHQYFGFQTCNLLPSVIEEARHKGIVFIEDRTQCLYSEFSVLPVDYIVGSLRKWTGLPDGGFAICRYGKFHKRPCEQDSLLESEKLKASYLKYDYIHNHRGDKKLFLELFERAEKILNEEEKYYNISPSSIQIQNSINIDELCQRRRKNYSYLYEQLKDIISINILTGKLKDDEVPLYFAITVDNRNDLQKYLREFQIYAPIVWPKSNADVLICKEADEIYNSILCLPIDQRYEIDDMERISIRVKEYFEKWK